MGFDTYSIVYHIASNFLPYFGVTLVMMGFLCWGLFSLLRHYRLARRLRRAFVLYLEEHRPRWEPERHH